MTPSISQHSRFNMEPNCGHHPANNSTWLVEDIHHGSSSNPGWLMHFVYNDVLYFTARDMMNVHDLGA